MTQKMKKGFNLKILIGWLGFLAFLLVVSLVTIVLRVKYYDDTIGKAFLFLINKVYLDNFLKQGALVLGTLTLVGYLLMKRGWGEAIIGALKTAIGIILVSIGAGVVVSMSRPVFASFQILGGQNSANIVPLDPYFGLASSQGFLKEAISTGAQYTAWVSYAFIIGLAVNILLIVFKKWTNVHSLMLTGHIMIQQSAIVVAFLYLLLFRNTSQVNGAVTAGTEAATVLVSGILLGTYWGVGSSATIKPTNQVTQNAGFAIGHQQMLGIALSYKIGKYFGKKEDNAENKKLPRYLKIFEDNVFTQTFILLILFIVLFTIVFLWSWNSGGVLQIIDKNGAFDNLNQTFKTNQLDFKAWNTLGGAHWSLNIFAGILKLVAGLIALITGVRMFVTELQQSFQGISEKLIPDSVVAVDVAASYGFSPNSVTYGFIAGTIAQYAAVAVTIIISLIIPKGSAFSVAIPIPLFITLFFNSGSLGVYANATGGYKAAIIVPAIIGFFEILLISFALGAVTSATQGTMVGVTGAASLPTSQGYNGMADWNFFFAPILLLSVWNTVWAWIVVVVVILGLLAFAQVVDSGMQEKKTFLQKMFKLNPELVNHKTE